jgi:hypothetical protein
MKHSFKVVVLDYRLRSTSDTSAYAKKKGPPLDIVPPTTNARSWLRKKVRPH